MSSPVFVQTYFCIDIHSSLNLSITMHGFISLSLPFWWLPCPLQLTKARAFSLACVLLWGPGPHTYQWVRIDYEGKLFHPKHFCSCSHPPPFFSMEQNRTGGTLLNQVSAAESLSLLIDASSWCDCHVAVMAVTSPCSTWLNLSLWTPLK